MVKLDLRKKLSVGETWLIDVFGGYMSCHFIYRWDGYFFMLELAHPNYIYYPDFKKELIKEKFKEILSKIKGNDRATYLGITKKVN